MRTSEYLVCAACKKRRHRNRAPLEGWWIGPDHKSYCSEPCVRTAPKPKGRGHLLRLQMKAPEGATVEDVARWRSCLTQELAKLAVAAWQKEAEEEAKQSRLPPGRAREFVLDDYDRVFALWKSSEGIVLRDVDKRRAIGKYLNATRARASSGTRTGGSSVPCWPVRMDAEASCITSRSTRTIVATVSAARLWTTP